jgi:glycerophosphoryl diester phosphodiesterase
MIIERKYQVQIISIFLCSYFYLLPMSIVSSQAEEFHPENVPWIIAHRGASAYRPEHTLAAYQLAIEQGADFIEADLVITRDSILISRHENELSGTTNIADKKEFADRKTSKIIDGEKIAGWFSEDFTLNEIKTLNARERIPNIRPQNKAYEHNSRIPTLTEIIQLIVDEEHRSGKKVKIIPELKHPTYFLKEGRYLNGDLIKLSLGHLLIDQLRALKFMEPGRVYVQSFEVESLMNLKFNIMPEANVDFPLVQLLGDTRSNRGGFSQPYDMIFNSRNVSGLNTIYHGFDKVIEGGINEGTNYRDLVTDEGLSFMASRYASAISPWKSNLYRLNRLSQAFDGNGDGKAEIRMRVTGYDNSLIEKAHRNNLLVIPYTLRAEESFLAIDKEGAVISALNESNILFSMGVDALFIDSPDIGVSAREKHFEH